MLKGARIGDDAGREEALNWQAGTTRHGQLGLTKLKQGRHATCSPKRSGSSWSAHEVVVAGHRIGDSCTKVMTLGSNLLRRRGAVRSWKMMVLSNASSD